MSVDREWVWTCDECGKVERRKDYGLPRGWIFVKAREISHRCENCVESVPKPSRGEAQVHADR